MLDSQAVFLGLPIRISDSDFEVLQSGPTAVSSVGYSYYSNRKTFAKVHSPPGPFLDIGVGTRFSVPMWIAVSIDGTSRFSSRDLT